MLPRDMVLELDHLEHHATLSTFEFSLGTFLKMDLQVAFLNSFTARHRAILLEFANNLVQTHIGFESPRKIFLAVWALLLMQPGEATFADDCSTLLAVERRLGQFEAHYAFQLVEAQLLRIQIRQFLLDLTILDFVIELTLVF